jgi:hypothetical protein
MKSSAHFAVQLLRGMLMALLVGSLSSAMAQDDKSAINQFKPTVRNCPGPGCPESPASLAITGASVPLYLLLSPGHVAQIQRISKGMARLHFEPGETRLTKASVADLRHSALARTVAALPAGANLKYIVSADQGLGQEEANRQRTLRAEQANQVLRELGADLAKVSFNAQ